MQASGAGWKALWARWSPMALMLLGVSAWLWPLAVGGRMPVGGDVTQFSMGLMDFLSESLKAGRLPVWNDRWGYGFPGLAESQMGVYYPPHLLLYRFCFTELAYTLSLAFHTYLGVMGAYWAARQWSVSRVGSALAGFCFATSGFFLIHLAHQWGYTVAAWMPWAWGLTWRVLQRKGKRFDGWALTAVLALQMLPGHFQIAFMTQAAVLAMAAVCVFQNGHRTRVFWIPLALAGALPLAMCQLWPTWQLAQRAATQRTFEYLSGFAVSPFHFVSYIAPRFLHESPLWRPLAWDYFRTSPEEHLGYIGLVPLWLSLVAIFGLCRSCFGTRALTCLVVLSVGLSLGPYLPPFRWYSQLPGFSFFRAPARWGVATMLGLSLLAGLGWDRVISWLQEGRPIPRRAWLAIGALGILGVGLPLLLIESHEHRIPGARSLDAAIETLVLPIWPGGGLDSSDDGLLASVFPVLKAASQNDIVRLALIRKDQDPNAIFMNERMLIYCGELLPTFALWIAFSTLLWLSPHRKRLFFWGALVLVGIDMLGLKDLRAVGNGPILPLVEQSPLLARLAQLHRETGGRSIDSLGNLTMVGGGSPIRSYRTLDLPEEMTSDLRINRGSWKSFHARRWEGEASTADALRAANVAGWVDSVPRNEAGPNHFSEPALAYWLTGARPTNPAFSRFSEYRLFLTQDSGSRARHVVPSPSRAEFARTGRVLPYRSLNPEHVRIDLGPTTAEAARVPVIVSNLWDPEWTGTWEDSETGVRVPAAVESVFDRTERGGWQQINVPGPGTWTLDLRYEGRAVQQGQIVSAVAWTGWLLGCLLTGFLLGRGANRAAGAALSSKGTE